MTDCLTDSKEDVAAFAAWYRAKLLKELTELTDGVDGKLTPRDRFGLESLSNRTYREAEGNLEAAYDTVTSGNPAVVRKVLAFGADRLEDCLSEYRARFADSNPDAVEALAARTSWLADVLAMRLEARTRPDAGYNQA